MVYSIDSMHLNNGHIYPTQFMQIFGSASCVQQPIIPERLNQFFIVTHSWKEEILSFPMMCHSSKSVTCIKFKGLSYDRHVSEKVRSESILYLLIDKSALSTIRSYSLGEAIRIPCSVFRMR